ncbi:MAG: ABC transporter permease, partial [Bacteroidota bacterium]
NISGLSIGLASFILIMLYLWKEYSYDKFHPEFENIYRVSENQINEEGYQSNYATSFAPLAKYIQDEVPGIAETVRIYPLGNTSNTNAAQITNPENNAKYIENSFYFVDSSFFDIFGYELDEGDINTALNAPFSILITHRMLSKYFGGQSDVIGKELIVKDSRKEYSFVVNGILKNPPAHSHFQFDFLASFTSLYQIMPWIENWEYPPVHNYIKLSQNQDAQIVQQRIATLNNVVFEEKDASSREFIMTPVKDIHLKSNRENELSDNGNVMYLYLILVVAILILFIASINSMNLATANASVRVKEIGVRKTLGARKRQLIEQFLSESFVLTFIGFLLSLLIVILTLPIFNNIIGESLHISQLFKPNLVLTLIGMVIAVALVSGAYPAYFLSSFQTVSLLKGNKSKSGNANRAVGRGLVIFQFTVASILIVAALVVNQQINFLSSKDLGFSKDQLLVVPLRDTENQIRYKPLKDQWLKIPAISAVTASSGVPTKEGLHEFTIYPEAAAYDSLSILTLTVDQDFVKVYDLELLKGRDFSADFATDAKEAVVINESAAKKLGWDDPLGKSLELRYYYKGEKKKKARVIGLVKDFNYQSLHSEVEPIVMHMVPNSYFHDFLTVKFNSAETTQMLASMTREWNQYNQDRPFEYSFLDETFANLYWQEARMQKIFFALSFIAIFIACLGLYALSSFICAMKTKEIGIRKTLGASVANILVLLSHDFGKIILISFLISLPLSWLVAQQWLNNFAYRIEPSVEIFLLSGILIVLIGCFTISFQTWRTATLNPVKTLRHE